MRSDPNVGRAWNNRLGGAALEQLWQILFSPEVDTDEECGGFDLELDWWCGVVRCGVKWCGVVMVMVWCGCGAVRCGVVRCDVGGVGVVVWLGDGVVWCAMLGGEYGVR